MARIGGDEFAVVLPHASASEAQLVARELSTAVGGTAASGLAASIGVALYCDAETMDVETLLTQADAAMYEAKRAKHPARPR